MLGFARRGVERVECRNSRGLAVRGKVRVPKGEGPFPLVVYSHGYGYNMAFVEAERLAEAGIAVCEFDFCGGSPWSRSDGRSTDMSVLTEADDLEAVLDELLARPWVDRSRVFLSGGSQGGFVSIIVGGRRQRDVAGMVLYCPALVIADFEQEYLGGRRMPERMRFGNMTVSRRYYTDARDCGVYHMMERFEGPVLYYHGSADEMVPLRYAYEAERRFPDARLTVLPGAGHMLNYGFEDQLFQEMRDFVLGGDGTEEHGRKQGASRQGGIA